MRIAAALAAAVVMASAASAQFQRRGGRTFGYGPRVGKNPAYDGAWTFCRIIFRNAPNGDGNGWFVDWPRADENLSFRFSELTRTSVSRAPDGSFNHVAIPLTDQDTLSHCPFIMMTEPGGADFDDAEAEALRLQPQKSGSVWAEAVCGEYAWRA